jgi:putative transposase
MAHRQGKHEQGYIQGALLDDPGFLRGMVQQVLQEMLEVQATERLGAGRYERTDRRTGYRNGSYVRSLRTRVGEIELSVPRARDGQFQPMLFASYQRHERALLLALMEMVLQGVSTRKISEITEQLCGTSYSDLSPLRLREVETPTEQRRAV